MQFRWISAFGLTLASMAAHASFDLMIVPDTQTGGFIRYDPVNRTALGTVVARGGTRVTAVASNPNGLYYDSIGWLQLNNFTGDQVSIPTTADVTLQYNLAGTKVATHTPISLSINSISPTTGLLVSGPVWGNQGAFRTVGVIPVSGNRWVVYGYSSAGISVFMVNDNCVTQGSLTAFETYGDFLQTGFGMATRVLYGSIEYVVIAYRLSNGTHSLATAMISGSGFVRITTQTLTNFSTANLNTSLGLVAGHTGFFVVGADATNPNLARITEMDVAPAFAPVSSYTTNAFTPPTAGSWRMSNLIAPEPNPMIGVGASLALLIGCRRRKK